MQRLKGRRRRRRGGGPQQFRDGEGCLDSMEGAGEELRTGEGSMRASALPAAGTATPRALRAALKPLLRPSRLSHLPSRPTLLRHPRPCPLTCPSCLLRQATLQRPRAMLGAAVGSERGWSRGCQGEAESDREQERAQQPSKSTKACLQRGHVSCGRSAAPPSQPL